MDIKAIVMETYTIILPFVLGYIIWLLQQNKAARDANSEGTRALIMIKLIEYHDKYCRLGYIPMYVHSNVEILYKAYHKLGGNGTITRMKEEMDKLDIRKEPSNEE